VTILPGGARAGVYGADAVEAEFVTAAGNTPALRTLGVGDVRPARDDDLLAPRPTPSHAACGRRPPRGLAPLARTLLGAAGAAMIMNPTMLASPRRAVV
jgi:hypothetical protein